MGGRLVLGLRRGSFEIVLRRDCRGPHFVQGADQFVQIAVFEEAFWVAGGEVGKRRLVVPLRVDYPLSLNGTKVNGTSERFFLRAGNSTEELAGRKAQEYIHQRFMR